MTYKSLLAILIYCSLHLNLVAQNYLPYVWKIGFDVPGKENNKEVHKQWYDVNLLLSWERQGLFWHNGNGCLETHFTLPDSVLNQDMILEFSLQCNITSIWLNAEQIAENIPNSFWSNRDRKTQISIPHEKLHAENQFAFYVSDLSYTGGLSHNVCTLSPVKSSKINSINIQIPNADHVYSAQPVEFIIQYSAISKAVIDLTVYSDFHQLVFQKSYPVIPKNKTLAIDLSREIKKSGFYECCAILHGDGHAGTAEWIGYNPEAITCEKDTIAGFSSYWKSTIDELQKVEPNFRLHKVDSLSRGARDGYVVEMQSLGNLTIRGYYFVPRKPGKFPVLLHVPGYGWGFDNIVDFNQSTEDVIEMAICVRGHGISADVFNPGFGTPGIWGWKVCSKDSNAYRGVYMDCLRAIDFLLSRTEVDKSKIGVLGGSQGGGLTLVTAGLYHDKIAACGYFDPFPCDLTDFINIRQQCQTELQLFLDYYNNTCSWQDAMTVQELINTKGFAHFITCPTLFVTALFDDDCPTHVGFAAYNLIQAPKQYKIFPNDSHLAESGEYDYLRQYLKKQFGF